MEILEEQNPLETVPTGKACCKLNNVGRPCNAKQIKFSPQPRSIISQLLLKEKNEEKNKNINNDCCVEEIREYSCRNCSHRCSNEIEYKKHLKTHEPMYICEYPQCCYVTKFSSNLIRHRRTHTGDKPYICDKCPFQTKFSNSLSVHRRIHTSERPYCCKYCDYRCNSISNLKKHCGHRHSLKSQ